MHRVFAVIVSSVVGALALSGAHAQEVAEAEITGDLIETCPARGVIAEFEVSEVRENGLVGNYFAPAADGPRPALLVLGGSEGGLGGATQLGYWFASHGYAVLSLAYFGTEDLPNQLENIPLEYFRAGVDWLAAQEGVDSERLGVYGISKGGEAALLIASRDERLRAVGAGVPSHAAWQSINTSNFFATRSSWTKNGEPVPFQTYALNFNFTNIRGFYEGVFEGRSAVPEAVIPVEAINGPVLVISGGQDRIWPSDRMSELVLERLGAEDFTHAATHLHYADAGHEAAFPLRLESVENLADPSAAGGSAAANAAARLDMWPRLSCFFDAALNDGVAP
ncbi:MAG: acyl-CoA thioester hydrolase/BAAT C-terminal domain-containing protein [Maricaulaceae bacterium]|jgi:dienelactone hydrolase